MDYAQKVAKRLSPDALDGLYFHKYNIPKYDWSSWRNELISTGCIRWSEDSDKYLRTYLGKCVSEVTDGSYQ